MEAVHQKAQSKLTSTSCVLQDITSLLHTIYEVVDASVNHSPSSSKTLRVKLSVAPDSSQRWRSCTQGAAGKARINTVGGGRGEERAFWGPPCVACCQLAQRCVCCHAERRLLQACQSFVTHSFGVAPSLPLNGVHF